MSYAHMNTESCNIKLMYNVVFKRFTSYTSLFMVFRTLMHASSFKVFSFNKLIKPN